MNNITTHKFSNARGSQGKIKSFLCDESGATVIEYGLIVGLIFLVIVTAVVSFSSSTSDLYGTIDNALE